MQVAKACRAAVKDRYVDRSCIETAFLFERTAHHLGLPASRVVCQVLAISKLMAAELYRGVPPEEIPDEYGYWSVHVGQLQFPEDYVGRMEDEKNRFVGHVVCLVDGRLIDPSADQMNRPAKGLILDEPVIARLDDEEPNMAYTLTPHGVSVRYTLHPDVPVPKPKSDRILERIARRLAKELQASLRASSEPRVR